MASWNPLDILKSLRRQEASAHTDDSAEDGEDEEGIEDPEGNDVSVVYGTVFLVSGDIRIG